MNPPASKARLAFILACSATWLFTVANPARGADNLWVGGTSTDWNTPSNWSLGTVPTNPDNAVVNSTPANVATITANLSQTPRDIIVGINNGNTGTVFHVSGTGTAGNGNWLAIGVVGGTGTYNLTNTTPTGGNISGFGQGSGTVSTSDRIIVGEQGGNGTLNINTTGSASSTSDIHVGNGANSVGTVNLASGTLNGGNSGWLLLGTGGGQGTLNMTGGTVHIARETLVGSDANTVASLNIRGGNYSTGETGNLPAYIGRTGGTGNLNVADTTTTGGAATGMGTGSGSFSQNGALVIGVDTGSVGTARINTTGTVTVTGNIQIGENFGGGAGTGRWFMDNGTVNAGNETWIGNNSGGNGTMTISGGTYNAPNWVAVGRFGGTGVLTINGTGVLQKTNTNGSLEITNNGSTTASGTVNLDGGSLIVNNVTGSGGAGSTSIFNFNGGTLKPTVNNTDFIGGNVVTFVKAGGATIDTNGFDITVSKNLTAHATSTGGGLTKRGTGTLTLTGASTYTGPTAVSTNGGTLKVDNNNTTTPRLANTSGITVNSGGTLLLAQTGVVSNDRINNGAAVTLAGGTLDTGGLNEGPAGGASGSSAAMGTLTLNANSIIDFTSGTGSNLLFASLGYAPGDAISIRNWTGMIRSDNGSASNDRLLFTTPPGFTDAQLASIQFYDDIGSPFAPGATLISFNGYSELVPIPEPAAIFTAFGLLGLVGYRERRRAQSSNAVPRR